MNDSPLDEIGSGMAQMLIFPATCIAGLYAGLIGGTCIDYLRGRSTPDLWPLSPEPLFLLMYIPWNCFVNVPFFLTTALSIGGFLMLWMSEEPRWKWAAAFVVFIAWAIVPHYA